MRFRAWRRFGEAEKGVAAIAAGIAAGAAADLALGDVAADVVFRSVGGIRPLYQKTARFRYGQMAKALRQSISRYVRNST